MSYDMAIVTGLMVCKHCRQLFANARWNKKIVLTHLYQVHKVPLPADTLPKVICETSPAPIVACQSMEKHKDAKVTPLPEVILIDYLDTANHFGKSLPMDQPIKKKRGRKPKPKVEGVSLVEKKKRGPKPKPKDEGLPIVEKKKRGRKLKGEKKIVPEKKMRVLKPQVSCEAVSGRNESGSVILDEEYRKM